MLIGVVSDTHNNSKNIDQVVDLFNKKKVELVIHTGDIASSSALRRFSKLNCDLVGVYGNNDREELGLKEVEEQYNFHFQEPPFPITLNGKKIVIFHEPDSISNYLIANKDVDLVLHGHTHRFRHECSSGTVIFNPGESAGILKGKNAIGLVDLENVMIQRIFF